jgi:hypothetical protein
MGKVYYENCGFVGLFGKQEATPNSMFQWCSNNKNIKKGACSDSQYFKNGKCVDICKVPKFQAYSSDTKCEADPCLDSQVWDDDAQACVDKPRILSEACGDSTEWNENLKKCENKCSNNERWDAGSGTCKEMCVGNSQRWNELKQKCESFLHLNNFTVNRGSYKNLTSPLFNMRSNYDQLDPLLEKETHDLFLEECAFKCEKHPECDFFRVREDYSMECEGGKDNSVLENLRPYDGSLSDYPRDKILYYTRNG